MYDENVRNSQGIFFPLLLKSHSGEGPIYFSRDDNNNNTSFFDNKLQSKEFQLQYNKLFNTMSPFIPMNHNNSNINNNNKLKQVEEVLHSLETISIITNGLYLKLSECLFDMIQLTNTLPNDNRDYAKGLLYQAQLIDKMIYHLKLKLPET